MKILIPHDNVVNGYIPSLIKAYKNAQCEVVIGKFNLYLSNYEPDILHIHWPEHLYDENCMPFDRQGEFIVERIKMYRDQGAKIVLTAHNLWPHDKNQRIKRQRIYNSILEYSDIIIHHGQASIDLMKKNHPKIMNKTHIVCSHGHYLIHYRNISKKKAREYLHLPGNSFIVLSFGSVKPYKGFELLRKIFKKWKHKNKLLVVAGSYDYNENLFSILRRKTMEYVSKYTGREKFYFKKIRTQDICYYFSAADLLMMSHINGLTSGVLSMAATYSTPVVYPDIGNFKEQMESWIGESYKCGSVESAIGALDAISMRIDKGLDINNKKWLEKNSWDKHVKKILSAMSK